MTVKVRKRFYTDSRADQQISRRFAIAQINQSTVRYKGQLLEPVGYQIFQDGIEFECIDHRQSY
ncbi:hypothetical protein [Vibrio marisflavi]|uniref:Uncharacterized protein n=1 Tax=Vibrio marisflavi CECT 7928 TaxID=634439 RepID=A0ABM9A9M6_9VIBR|nr:hypothetical protein [Vibrio marisflavi]CAH0542999.1 hypothetical protein VMF7928_04353 [Vibrio marisflavi CECT 7928]